jgi:hypothetical protein
MLKSPLTSILNRYFVNLRWTKYEGVGLGRWADL